MSTRPVEFSLRSYVPEAVEQRPLVSATTDSDTKSGLKFEFASLNKPKPAAKASDPFSSIKLQQLRAASETVRENAKSESMRLSAANEDLNQRLRKQTERAVAAEGQVQKLYTAIMSDRQTAAAQTKVAHAEAAKAKATEQQLREELIAASKAGYDIESKLSAATARMQAVEAASDKVAAENVQLKSTFTLQSSQLQKLTDEVMAVKQKSAGAAVALEKASAVALERESERNHALDSLANAKLATEAAVAERKEAMSQLASVFQTDENRSARLLESTKRVCALEEQCVQAGAHSKAAEARACELEASLSEATAKLSAVEARESEMHSKFEFGRNETTAANGAAAELKQQLDAAAARATAAEAELAASLEAKAAIASELQGAVDARDALIAQAERARPQLAQTHPNADPIAMAAKYDRLRSQLVALNDAAAVASVDERQEIVDERDRIFAKASKVKEHYESIFGKEATLPAASASGSISGVGPGCQPRTNGAARKFAGVSPLGRAVHFGTADAEVSAHVAAISAMDPYSSDAPPSDMVTAVVSDLSAFFKHKMLEAKRNAVAI